MAVANAAGTTAANVEIISITDGRRRAGSVKVETKVTAVTAGDPMAISAADREKSVFIGTCSVTSQLCLCRDLLHKTYFTLKHAPAPVPADPRE